MNSWPMTVDEASRRQGKLAPQLAKQIEIEIFRSGWPVGQSLGQEEALAARFGVSRTIIREALSITERDGVTRRQRGRTGGVYVAEPAQESVVMALGNYLATAGLTEQQYSEGHATLSNLALTLACERCTAEQAQRARKMAKQPEAFELNAIWRRINQLNKHILAMSQNRALEIFCAASVYSGMQRMYAGLIGGNIKKATHFANSVLAHIERELESVIGGNLIDALQADRSTIQDWLSYYDPLWSRTLSTVQAEQIVNGLSAIYHPEKTVKRADVLAFQLHWEIASGGYQPGERLDNEATLLQRYHVSRGALREAIRALEQDAVVKTEEGRSGGLCVAEPDPSAVVRSAVIYFRFLNLSAEALGELGLHIELAMVNAVANQVKVFGSNILNHFSQLLHDQPEPKSSAEAQARLEALYSALASASGNPFFELIIRLLTATLTIESSSTDSEFEVDRFNRFIAQMQAIESALREADACLARRHFLDMQRLNARFRAYTRDLAQLMDRVYSVQ